MPQNALHIQNCNLEVFDDDANDITDKIDKKL